jgi:hypothetical protein
MAHGKEQPSGTVFLIANGVALIVLGILAGVSGYYHWWLWLAAAVGGLGGLVHEFAQSGGRIVFFQQNRDGLYLGSLAGVVLGAVAGILVIRGHLIGSDPGAAPLGSVTQLSYECFFAGLALKGVSEAASGTVVPPASPPSTPLGVGKG